MNRINSSEVAIAYRQIASELGVSTEQVLKAACKAMGLRGTRAELARLAAAIDSRATQN